MIKNLILLFSLIIFGASPALVFAQDTTVTTTTTPFPARGLMTSQSSGLKDIKTQMRGDMQQMRADYKTKIATIKDARKQKIVTNLDSRIKNINTKRTGEVTKRLERLTLILDRISSQEADLQTKGANTTTPANDIKNATTAIESAKQAVEVQTANDYVIQITTDEKLRSAAQTTIQQFLTDMKSVYVKVSAAQEAVLMSYNDMKTLKGESVSPTATTPQL